MNEFQIALAVGAVIAVVISYRLPRAALWILAGAVSFILSTMGWRYAIPHPPAITMTLDAGVCLLLYFFAKEQWEERVYKIFQMSVLISVVYLSGPISAFGVTIHMSHWLYVLMLEICNWLALAVIGGTAIMDRVKEHENGADYSRDRNLHHARASWREDRSTQPFHKAHR